MLKRIKETLTYADSGGKHNKLRSRIRHKLISHHLLHSDKSTCFYNNSKVNKLRFFFKSLRWPEYSFTSPRNTTFLRPVVTGASRLFLARGAADGFLGEVKPVSDKVSSKGHKLTPFSVAANRANLSHNKFSTIPLALSSIALLLVFGVMICPSVESETLALEGDTAAQSAMNVALAMDNPDENVLQDKTSQAGQINYISRGFKVKANNVDSYNVYLQTAPGATNKLTSGNISIDFVKTDTPANGFTDNTWGYKIDDTGAKPENLTYNPVPDSGTTALNPAYSSKVDTGEDGKHFTLNFAAKFASDAKPGHYTTDVILSVAAGAHEVVVEFPKWTINNMQDMNPAICADAKENTTGQLTDLRDGKQYWVTKLKDGNCWMTQNLDLDLKQGQPLTPELSDVQTDWTPGEGEGTIATGELNSTNWPNDDTVIRSYDPGEYVNTKPITAQSCGAKATLDGCPDWESYSGKTASNNPNFGITTTDTTYNGHYAAGNYYSYNAATVESGLELTNNNQDANASICPKGWQLPVSGKVLSAAGGNPANYPLNRNRGFVNLLETYGWGNWRVDDQWGNPISDIEHDEVTVNPTSAPIYLLRNGWLIDGTIKNAGFDGRLWSSTSHGTRSSYDLLLTSSAISPSYVNDRAHGFAVRCVARGENTFTVKYEKGNMPYGEPPAAQTITTTADSAEFTVASADTLSHCDGSGFIPGSNFKVWSDGNKEYAPGDKIVLTTGMPTITLSAVKRSGTAEPCSPGTYFPPITARI